MKMPLMMSDVFDVRDDLGLIVKGHGRAPASDPFVTGTPPANSSSDESDQRQRTSICDSLTVDHWFQVAVFPVRLGLMAEAKAVMDLRFWPADETRSLLCLTDTWGPSPVGRAEGPLRAHSCSIWRCSIWYRLVDSAAPDATVGGY